MHHVKDSKLNKKKYILNVKNYKIIKLIRTGGFGSIYLVENNETKEQFAAKIIVIPENNKNLKKMINSEIEIMIKCQHPTIINFLGYSFQDFFNQQNITIFMNYAQKGSLADILTNARHSLSDINYNNTVRQKILIGIARALMHLHQNNIIHRDLKPGNILIDGEFHPKLTDFGLSKANHAVFSTSQSIQCGTSIYMAPEMIKNEKCSAKVDVYSFAILMYEVVTDAVPYPLYSENKMSLKELHDKIVNENYRPTFKVPVKKSIQNLIKRCWSEDPNKRPSFEEIFKMLAYNIDDSSYDREDLDDDDDDEENAIDEYKYYLDGSNEDEILSYVDEIDFDNDECIRTTKIIESVYQKLSDITIKVELQANENDKLKKSITNIIKENEEIKKAFEYSQNESKELRKEIKKMKNIIDKCMIENQEIKEAFNNCMNENHEMKEMINKYKQNFQKMTNENKEMTKVIGEMREAIEIHQNENNKFHDSIEYCQNEIMMLKQLSEIQPKLYNDDNDKTDSHSIHELKESIIKEGKKIEDFNILSLIEQKTIISNIKTKTNADAYNPFLIRFENLINYIIQLNRGEIIAPGLRLCQRADENNQILIPFQITEILFMNKVLKKSPFTEILKEFRNIAIEFKYPSNNYNEIFNALKNLTKIVGYKIYLCGFITGITHTDDNLNNNNYLDSVKFNYGIDQIGGPSRSFFYINLTHGPFEYCSYLSQIEIPSSVTVIGCRAFYCCRSLTKVIIPNSVITIGEYAFYRCSLSYIKIPSSVRSIGYYAFYDCLSNFQALIPANFNNTKDIFPSKAIINRY